MRGLKKRYIYAFLFGAPGFFLSLIISVVVFGVTAGIFWLYIFGDDPWPRVWEKILSISFILTFLALWMGTIVTGFITGKALEREPALNRNHVVVSAVATIAPIALLIFHQFRVGNVGPKPASILCSELCIAKGYVASGTPPRDSGDMTCSCFDEHGREIIKLEMEKQ